MPRVDGMGPAKARGAFFSPEDVAAALVAWTQPGATEWLIDPACGDGRFIARHENSFGVEIDEETVHRAKERAPWASVQQGEFFTWAAQTDKRFECAAGNPPFIRYQRFAADSRSRAVELCARLGVTFSGLSSSWAPFLVGVTHLLKRNGRMAFIVPAEIGHAPYARPLVEYLLSSFRTVHIVAIREKLFPTLSENCWLLYADGFGAPAKGLDFTALERFQPALTRPAVDLRIQTHDLLHTWKGALRPFLLTSSLRNGYAQASTSGACVRLSEFATVGIGYISGDNDFFHLRLSEAKRRRIPPHLLHPSVRRGRMLPNKVIDAATVAGWMADDEPALLLRLDRTATIPSAVIKYLSSQAGKRARTRFKCRTRRPWYSVPGVRVPDQVMTYLSGREVAMVENRAGVTCTNSLHCVTVTDHEAAARFLPMWGSDFVKLSCEIEGHPLGGGMLKLEPGEAGRILFPTTAQLPDAKNDDIQDGLARLRRWRHVAD